MSDMFWMWRREDTLAQNTEMYLDLQNSLPVLPKSDISATTEFATLIQDGSNLVS